MEAGEECAGSRSVRPILGIKAQDGRIVTSDQDKAEILNEHFSAIGEKLTNEFPPFSEEDGFTHITRVTPTVMNIELTHDAIGEGLEKLKADKACGPDKVAPRLLKAAGDTIIPSRISIYKSSASRNLVPDKWEAANVSPLYKKDDETDKHNTVGRYPFSVFPGSSWRVSLRPLWVPT